MKTISLTLVLASALALPLSVQAQNPPQAAAVVAKAPGVGLASEAVQFQGKIKSVDKKTRSVVVVGPNGNEIMLNLSDEVKNFDQIKKGDLVTLTMMHAVALELRKVANNGIRERVDKRLSVFGEKLAGSGEVRWLGSSRLVEFLVKREESPPEVSIVYGLLEDK